MKDCICKLSGSSVVLEFDSTNGSSFDKTECDHIYFLIRVGRAVDKQIMDLVRQLREAHRSCKIILYDYQRPIDSVVVFFRESIDGYLHDSFTFGDFADCISTVDSDRLYLNTELVLPLLTSRPARKIDNHMNLTPIESKVARLLMSGMKNSMIANELNRDRSTICTIKANIFRKTNVSTLNDLMLVLGDSQVLNET